MLEAVSFHVFSDDDLRDYERRDAATSITMGLGSLVFTAIARGLALIGYAALYELTPLRVDPAHGTTCPATPPRSARSGTRGWRDRVGYVLRPPGWRPPAGV